MKKAATTIIVLVIKSTNILYLVNPIANSVIPIVRSMSPNGFRKGLYEIYVHPASCSIVTMILQGSSALIRSISSSSGSVLLIIMS